MTQFTRLVCVHLLSEIKNISPWAGSMLMSRFLQAASVCFMKSLFTFLFQTNLNSAKTTGIFWKKKLSTPQRSWPRPSSWLNQVTPKWSSLSAQIISRPRYCLSEWIKFRCLHKYTQQARATGCGEVTAGVFGRRGQMEADNESSGAVWWPQLKVNSTAGLGWYKQ